MQWLSATDFKVSFTDDMSGEKLYRNIGYIGVCAMLTIAVEIGRGILSPSKVN